MCGADVTNLVREWDVGSKLHVRLYEHCGKNPVRKEARQKLASKRRAVVKHHLSLFLDEVILVITACKGALFLYFGRVHIH